MTGASLSNLSDTRQTSQNSCQTGENRWDIAVIGGGAVGLATAMDLAVSHQRRVVVLEAEATLAAHQTGHNSGVIHSGLYYKPGSLKARFCTEGRELMYQFCQTHGIPHERCGKVVVATDDSQIPALDELERRGAANGLSGVRRLSGAELREIESHVAGVAGLLVKQTGIVDFPAAVRQYARIVTEHGGSVRTNARVSAVHRDGADIIVESTAGEVRAMMLVNCAGLQCDRVARLSGVDPGVQIIPFRGEYYELADSAGALCRNLIYPVPDARFPFLGVHLTRMIHGGVEAGPNAVLALARHGYTRTSFQMSDTLALLRYSGFWKMAGKYWKTGMGEVWRSASKRAFLKALQRLLPALKLEDLKPGGAGVRAQAVAPDGKLLDDFHIVQAPGMVHVLNAPSPAATASIRIGKHIAELAMAMIAKERTRLF